MKRTQFVPSRTAAAARAFGVLLLAAVSCPQLLAQTYLNASYQAIAWQVGSQVHIQPASTAARNQTELTLNYDATLGARLVELRNKVAGAQLRAFPADPGGLSTHSGLWGVRLLPTPIPSPNTVPTEVGPTATLQVYTVGGTNTTTSAVFVWPSIAMPGTTETLAVELKLTATPRLTIDSAVTAEILCRRTVPTPGNVLYQIDSVDVQVTLQEETPNPTDPKDHGRVLVPVHYTGAVPINNVSIDYMAWRGHPELQSWSHPGLHEMQFSGFHHPGHASSVYLGTEDYRGYRKFFRYWSQVVSGSRWALSWRSRYVPEHDTDPTNDGFLAPYPTLIHTLANPEATWWYDIAALYRDLIQNQPSGPGNNIVKAPVGGTGSVLNPVVTDNCVVMIASHINAPGANPYTGFYDEMRAVQTLLDGTTPSNIPAFLQIQQWMLGNGTHGVPMGPDTMPDTTGPPAPDPVFRAHPNLATEMAAARGPANKISTTLYAFPGLFRITSNWPTLSSERAIWLRHTPNTDIHWLGLFQAPQARLDFGKTSPAAPSWVADWFANTVLDDNYSSTSDMRGIYLDAVAGGGPLPRYPQRSGFPPVTGPFHGGAISQEGRIEAFDLARARLATRIGTTPTSQHPEIPVVFGEFIEEYLAGHMDLCQRGLRLYPGQGLLADPPMTGANWQSRDLLPPTWSFVYHETAPAHAVGMQLTLHAYNQMVAPPSNVPPATAAADYLDMFAYTHGLMLTNGMNPLVFGYDALNPVQDRMFDHQLANGFGPTVPGDATKLQIATAVRDMIRGFHSCRSPQFGGAFLTKGRRERPLRENHGSTIGGAYAIDRGYSPMTKIWDWMRSNAATYQDPLPIEFLPFTSQDLDKPGSTNGSYLTSAGTWPGGIGDSPKVVHSVWSHSSQPNQVVIAFWNWSAAAARWEGVFDPGLYGAGGQSYSVTTMNTVSGVVMTQGGLSGASTLVFDVAVGGQVGLSINGTSGEKLPSRVPYLVVINW